MRRAHCGLLAGSAMKVSRLTSRQPPQSEEICLNCDSIQSAAALMPRPGGRSVSMLVRVLRVPKSTSEWIICWTCAASIVLSACAMAGSGGAGAMGAWPREKSGWARQGAGLRERKRPAQRTITRRGMERRAIMAQPRGVEMSGGNATLCLLTSGTVPAKTTACFPLKGLLPDGAEVAAHGSGGGKSMTRKTLCGTHGQMQSYRKISSSYIRTD